MDTNSIRRGPAIVADAALQPATVLHSPGAKYAAETRLFQGIPGMERSPSGRLWATWYAGGPDEPGEGPGNYVLLVTSADQGKSWSEPCLVIDPPGAVRAYDSCVWLDPKGRLWLFWAQAYGGWDGRGGVWCIVTDNADDACPIWSQPRRLADGVMMNKPTVLGCGTWLLPVSVWDCLGPQPLLRLTDPREVAPNAELILPPQDRRAWVMASGDAGETWHRRGGVTMPDRSFDEHSIVERRDGSLWMLARVLGGIGQSLSEDEGWTWSRGTPSPIANADARFFVRRLASGNLLLVTHNAPERTQRSHLAAWLSGDDGASWAGGLCVDDRIGIAYPDGFQSPDGSITVCYDFNRTQQKEIWMTTFTEADIARAAAGPRSSPPWPRQLINRAALSPS